MVWHRPYLSLQTNNQLRKLKVNNKKNMDYIIFLIILAAFKLFYLFNMPIVTDNDSEQIAKQRRWILSWRISVAIIIFISALSFHIILGNDRFFLISKKELTFSNTFITISTIEDIVKRYGEASFLEKQSFHNDPLFRKLMEENYIEERNILQTLP
jgi:hypothetical protein